MTEEYISALGKISHKYIHLNDTVAPLIENDIQRLICGKKTIGVHVRGTDFKHNYKWHPICITPEEYLAQVVELLEHGKYERVFLATDDSRTIELFNKELEDKLVLLYRCDQKWRGRGRYEKYCGQREASLSSGT